MVQEIQLRIYQYILEKIYIIIGKIRSVSKYYYEIIFISKIVLSDDIFSSYIEEDNKKITILLQKIKNIYGKFIKKKKIYYFLKYYSIMIRIKAKEMKFLEKNRSYKSIIYINKDQKLKPFYLSELDCLENRLNLNNSNNNIQYIDSYSILNPNYTSSIVNSIRGNNYHQFNNNTERIMLNKKSNSKNKNNFKKINKLSNSRSNTMNNCNKNVNFNSLKRLMNKSSRKSVNKKDNNNLIKENAKNKRTLSYGNLEINIKRDNNRYKNFNKNKYIFKNCNFISNIESYKEIPSYTTSSPNGYIYPTILTNNIDNSIKNNKMNNNIFSNYQVTTTISSDNSKKARAKPSLWYCNTFSLQDQVSSQSSLSPLPCNNSSNIYSNEKVQKYFNNSSNFNSISNFDIINSKDFLNNQIYNFIKNNSKSKDKIGSKNKNNRYNDFKRKEKLINRNSRKNILNKNIFSKKLNNINHRKKNNSFFTMSIGESTQFPSEGINIDKSDKTNDKSLKNYNLPLTSSVRHIYNYNNDSKLISIGTNYIKSPKINNKYKKKNYLKIDNDYKCNNKPNSNCHTTPFEMNEKKNIIIENIKRVKIEYNNKNNNIYNNFSVIYNNNQLDSITNNNTKDNNRNKENHVLNRNNNINNINNFSFNKNHSPKNKYCNKNLSHNNIKIGTVKNNNENKMNYIKNRKNLILQKGKKKFLKNDNVYQHSISFSTLNTNRNHKKFKTHNYEVSHNVAEEQFINKNNLDENNEELEEQNNINNDSLTISMQSMNDSKILELAKHYIDEEKIIDKGKISEILSDKNTKKTIKNYNYY